MFDRITRYENRIIAAAVKKLPNGKFQVSFTVSSKKLVADSLGTERPVAQSDYLPLAVFAALGKDKKPVPPLLLNKRRLHAGDNKFELVTAREPAKVVVDPSHEFIDRVQKDNSQEVKL